MLHDSGTAGFEAALHEWHDLAAILSQGLESGAADFRVDLLSGLRTSRNPIAWPP